MPTVDQAPPAVLGVTSSVPSTTAADLAAVAALVDEVTATVEVAAAAPTRVVPTQVLGVTLERTVSERPTEVLGVSFERGTLARTGVNITMLILLAVALLAIGMGCKRVASRA